MKTQLMAMLLHGREYPLNITKEEQKAAKDEGLVIVYGASDDLMEFEGAIYDEVGCIDGGKAYLNAQGLCKKKNATAKVKAVWCPKDEEGNVLASWVYETDIPHHTFDVMEDGELYCRGIVFELAALNQKGADHE